MTPAQDTILDLNTMLSQTLDAIPEAAGFDNPPDGEYTILVKDCAPDSYKNKEGVEVARLKILYSVAATISTASGEQPVPPGTMFSETFQATEQGLGFFKKRVRELMGTISTDGVTLGDMMAAVKGVTVNARISTKKTPKKDVPGEFWENLNIRVVKAA